MRKNVYLSILSKISTVSPFFAKAMMDMAIASRHTTAETISPIEMFKIIRTVIDPKLKAHLTHSNSILLTGAALITTDIENIIVSSNSAGTKLAAFGAKHLLEAGLIKHPLDIDELEIREIPFFATSQTFNVSQTQVRDENQKVIGAQFIIQDITLKKALEDELISFCVTLEEEVEARKRAESMLSQQYSASLQSSKLAALGEMASGIAHEINNPLAIILGKADLLVYRTKDGKTDQAKFTTDINIIKSTTERIAKIVRGLKTFSRNAEHDPMEKTQVLKILDETRALCNERFKNSGISIEIECPENLAIECSPTQISQIIVNLLGNSFDAIHNRDEKWITMSATETADRVKIRVMDSGNGISNEIVENIMNPFFTTKDVGKGTGLGLSISKGIAESHHGRLSYDSSSKHTCFMLELPKLQPAPELTARKAG